MRRRSLGLAALLICAAALLTPPTSTRTPQIAAAVSPVPSHVARPERPVAAPTPSRRPDPEPASRHRPAPRWAKSAPMSRAAVLTLVDRAADKHGLDRRRFRALILCECGSLNPNAVGGAGRCCLGLGQQHRVYWDARAARYGHPGSSPFDAWANLDVTAGMIAAGYLPHWDCAPAYRAA